MVICSSICNGYFHDEEFPSYRELYELFQKDYHNVLPDCSKYGEYLPRKQEYVDKYRYGFGYHPYHAFSMISCGYIWRRKRPQFTLWSLRAWLCQKHGNEDQGNL